MNAGDSWPIARSVTTSLAYHMPTDSWEALPDLPADRASGGAAVIGHDLHFVGGGRFLPGRCVAASCAWPARLFLVLGRGGKPHPSPVYMSELVLLSRRPCCLPTSGTLSGTSARTGCSTLPGPARTGSAGRT